MLSHVAHQSGRQVVVRLSAALLMVVAIVAGWAPSAATAASTASAATAARAAEERVVEQQILLTVRPGGVLRARETIVYEFDGHPALERAYITKVRHSDTHDRIFKITGLTASSPDGGPTKVTSRADGDRTRVQVAAPASIDGRRTVVLEYDVHGAISPVGTGEELRWPAAGGWAVPVDTAQVTVEGGEVARSINCFAGPAQSSVGCSQFSTDIPAHTRSVFRQTNMLEDEYLTVIVGYAADATGGRPSYEQRRTLATAFSINPVSAGALLALLLALAGGFGLLYLLRGRDARTVGKKAPEGDHAPRAGDHFEPPDGVRPGQVGTLIDEQADVIDVTATIIDLAVRGHLLIEEEDRAATGRLDWALRRLDRLDDDLLPYERVLRDALFDGRDVVRLAELDGTFADRLAEVRSAMYQDVVTQGWFARRPDTVRSRWALAGIALTVAGVVGTAALAFYTDLALAGLAVIIGGAALTVGGRHMPAKTAKGATVLAHTIGFRAYLARGEAADDLTSEQRIQMFSRYLPYAVVFDLIAKWAQTVEDAGVQADGADNLYWYEGPAEWDLSKFHESIRGFTLATSGAISQSRQFRGL